MNHTHVYILPAPNGPTSDGKCSGCGDVRKGLLNYISEHSWGQPRAERGRELAKGKEALKELGFAQQSAQAMTKEPHRGRP
jgi:hypothetical protein